MKNIREALAASEVVLGVCCDISDPSVVETLGYAGWDFVLINAEGGTLSPYGMELENMIRAAYVANVVPAVKVPENNPAMIASALKLGAKMIEVPKISSRADVERALNAVRYSPKGERATCWGVPATKYGAVAWADHVRKANEDIVMYAVLEDQKAMENMDEILSTQGLEMVIPGPLDLSLRLGGVEDKEAVAKVKEFRQRLLKTARTKGVAVIEIVRDAAEAKEAVALGAKALLFGQDDLSMLRQASIDRLSELRNATSS